MKATPITSKAKYSPFKMNTALVANDAQVHKGFIDVREAMGAGLREGKKFVDDFSGSKKSEKGGDLNTEPSK